MSSLVSMLFRRSDLQFRFGSTDIMRLVSHMVMPPSAKPEGYDLLLGLALDLRWSWNHGADTIWNQLDPVLWDLTRNPWAILQTASSEKLRRFLSNRLSRAGR